MFTYTYIYTCMTTHTEKYHKLAKKVMANKVRSFFLYIYSDMFTTRPSSMAAFEVPLKEERRFFMVF